MNRCFLSPILPLLSLLVLAFPSTAQHEVDVTALKDYLDSARVEHGLTGMAVAIVKDGEVVMSEGYGVRDERYPDKKVTSSTSFAIASLSKAFTAAGVALLVERGELSWDDKVSDILPWFRLHDPMVTNMMTVEDLLCHRVGLKTFDGDLLWYGTDYSKKDVLYRIRNLPLTQEFRDDFGYQNIMYIAAGELIENVSELNWETFMRENFLKPLDMDLTRTSVDEFTKDQKRAMPHLEGEAMAYQNFDNAAPAAGLNSNVEDLTNWMRMLLNDGVWQEDTLLLKRIVQELFSLRTPLSANSIEQAGGTSFKGYGLGWFLMDYHDRKVAYHGGGLPGFISKIALVPEEDLGLIVLSNDMSGLPSALMYEVLDRYLAGEKHDRSDEFLTYKKKGEERGKKRKERRNEKREEDTEPSLSLKAYTGTFEDEMYGKASISMKEDSLFIDLHPTDMFQSTMEHWHHDVFKIRWNDPFLPRGFVHFDLNTDGEVEGFGIEMPNPDFHFNNLYFDPVGE